ncbi:hypothetical protein BS629_26705 [Rhizobium leguminosarum bv. viciae USDA 2370]|nr:hypothetical protein [Rhizobium leguminosarum]MBB5261709.1 hypothetical protein [Rhizobium leguminosarum]MDX6000645.1 hypothetical protein [Rhizobium leguminosarum]OOO44805.1 hypothetical protein BS629_26705 [Rhizobium leguminosarum bv. viciae USDA 2370]
MELDTADHRRSSGVTSGLHRMLTLIGEDDDKHLVSGFTAVAYDIPKGSIAGYYPEMNVVISLRHFDRQSGTPSYKGVPVRVKLAD